MSFSTPRKGSSRWCHGTSSSWYLSSRVFRDCWGVDWHALSFPWHPCCRPPGPRFAFLGYYNSTQTVVQSLRTLEREWGKVCIPVRYLNLCSYHMERCPKDKSRSWIMLKHLTLISASVFWTKFPQIFPLYRIKSKAHVHRIALQQMCQISKWFHKQYLITIK